MKKFRFLSSLTLASVIVSGTALAATGATKMLGEYKAGELNNAKNSSVVAFQLSDPSDRVLVDEIKDLGGYTNVNANGKTEVTTGDFITTNGTEEHKNVVVYGDVDGSGEVNLEDVIYASDIQGNMTQSHPGHTELNTEAADVQNNGEITLEDVIAISDFYGNTNLDYVKDVPEASKTPVVEAKYDFTVNGNNTVNDTNMDTSSVKIKSKNGRVEEKTEFDLYYIDEDGNEQLIEEATGLEIVQYADESEELSPIQLKTALEGVVEEGTEQQVTLVLKEKDSEDVVGTTTITVNRIHPEAVKRSARREGTEQGGLKFEAKPGKDIVKVYYLLKEGTSGETDANTITTTGKSATVENDKFDAVLDWNLKNNTAYAVSFVVENAAGNQSEVYTEIIPNDSSAKQEEKVTDVEVDDSSDNKIKVKFTEPLETSTVKEYIITIYDENGNIVDEVTASIGEGATGKDITDKISEGGKYTVTVKTKAKDGTSKDSEETEAVEFEVSQLAEVTGLHFETNIDETGAKTDVLKWDKYSDSENEAFSGYTINLYEYEGDGKYTSSANPTKNDVSAESTEIKLSDIGGGLTANKRYKATISANSSKGEVKASKPTETTTDYINLNVGTITPQLVEKKTDTTVEFTVTSKDAIEKLGDTVTYDVEVWVNGKVDGVDGNVWHRSDDIRKNVTVDEDGKITIDELTPGTQYKFVLIVHIDGDKAEGESALSSEVETKKSLPSLEGMVVAKTAATAEDTEGGKVYVDAEKENEKKLYIDGEEIKLTAAEVAKYNDPYDLLSDSDEGQSQDAKGYALKLISSLNEGDTIVSLTDEKVTIKAYEKATNGTDREIFANGKVLEIIGNTYEQDIKSLTANANEVILSGGLFKIDSDSTSEFTLKDGTKVLSDEALSGAKTIKMNVEAGATVNIDNIEVHSVAELKGATLSKDTTRKLFVDQVGEEALTFNNKSGEALIIEIGGDASKEEDQIGKVTVESNADVTIQAKEGAKVSGEISVSTTNGSVTVNSESLTGTKEVTVTTTAESTGKTITARTKLTSPIDLNNITIMPYTVAQLIALRDSGTEIKDSGLTQENLKELNNEQIATLVDYFNAFGSSLMNKGAKVTSVTANQEGVTITLPEGSKITLDAVTIGGLK